MKEFARKQTLQGTRFEEMQHVVEEFLTYIRDINDPLRDERHLSDEDIEDCGDFCHLVDAGKLPL
jgi:hypothetical protein